VAGGAGGGGGTKDGGWRVRGGRGGRRGGGGGCGGARGGWGGGGTRGKQRTGGGGNNEHKKTHTPGGEPQGGDRGAFCCFGGGGTKPGGSCCAPRPHTPPGWFNHKFVGFIVNFWVVMVSVLESSPGSAVFVFTCAFICVRFGLCTKSKTTNFCVTGFAQPKHNPTTQTTQGAVVGYAPTFLFFFRGGGWWVPPMAAGGPWMVPLRVVDPNNHPITDG